MLFSHFTWQNEKNTCVLTNTRKMLSLGFDEKTQDPIFQTNHIQNKKSKNFASVFKAMNSLIVSLEMKLDSDIPAYR